MSENAAVENKNASRDPLLAGILSFLGIGLGQAYNAQRRKGYLFIILFLACMVLLVILGIVVFKVHPSKVGGEKAAIPAALMAVYYATWLIIWIANIVDAYRDAKKINSAEISVGDTAGHSLLIFIRNIILSFVGFLALMIAVPIVLALVIGLFKSIFKF